MTDETNFRCPECNREIMNRAHELCLYCGALIPAELRFTDQEIRENEEKTKQKIETAEESRRKGRKTLNDVDVFGSF